MFASKAGAAQSLALSLGLSVALLLHTSQAATDTWTGNTTANWNAVDGFSTVPANGDLLVFGVAGSAGTTLNDNITSLQVGTSAASSAAITFNSGASAYTINGNTINIGATSGTQTIVNNSTNTQTFGTAFNLNGGVSAILQAASGTLTFNGVMGGGFSTDVYQITGPGTVNFTNTANTYGARTQLNSGILNVASLSNYGVAGSLGNRGTASDTYGGVEGLVFSGGTLQYTGSTAQSTNRQIRLSNGSIDASGSTTAATVSFTATVEGNIAAVAGPRTLTLTGTNTGTNTFAGSLLDNAGVTNIVKSGLGTWVYSGNNNAAAVAADTAAKGSATTRTTSGGSFTVNAGLLEMTGDNTLNTGGTTINASTSGSANAATLQPGTNTSLGSGAVTFSGSNSDILQAGAAGLSLANGIVTNNTSLGGGTQIDTNGNTLTLSGVISGSGDVQNINNSGTLNLTNTGSTYTGHLNITNGIVNVAALNTYGTNGPLGNRSSATDTAANAIEGLILNGGTLQYTGSSGVAQTTDRLIRLGATGFIDASGATTADTVTFSAAYENNIAATGGARTLTLTGSNTGNNTFAASLFDRAGGVTSLAKTGIGTWVYSGNNNAAAQTVNAGITGSSSTNGGSFTVSAGTLIITGDNSLRTGTNTVASAGTLALQNANALGSGGLTASSGSTLILQADANTSFAGMIANTSAFANAASGATVQNFQVNNVSTGSGNTLSFGTGLTTNTSGSFGQSVTYNVTSNAGDTLALGSIKVNSNSALIFNPTTANLSIQGITNGSTGGITKNGAGTLTLSNGSTSTGAATVNAGALLITGGTFSSVSVAVTGSGTTLGGTTATVSGTVSIGAGSVISAGSGSTNGIFTTGALTLASTSVFNAVVTSGGTAGTNYSQLVPSSISGITGSSFTVTPTSGATFNNGDVLTLISSSAFSTTNAFPNSSYTAGGYTFTADYTTNPGSFDVDVTPVPEPATVFAGVLLVGAFGWRCRKGLAVRRKSVA